MSLKQNLDTIRFVYEGLPDTDQALLKDVLTQLTRLRQINLSDEQMELLKKAALAIGTGFVFSGEKTMAAVMDAVKHFQAIDDWTSTPKATCVHGIPGTCQRCQENGY